MNVDAAGVPEGCDVEGIELARLCGVAGLRPTSAERWPEMTHPHIHTHAYSGPGNQVPQKGFFFHRFFENL